MNRNRSGYKDMDKYREARLRQKRRYYNQTATGNKNRPEWTCKECDMVLAHTIPDSELSKLIGRSVAAIQNRRCILKRGT